MYIYVCVSFAQYAVTDEMTTTEEYECLTAYLRLPRLHVLLNIDGDVPSSMETSDTAPHHAGIFHAHMQYGWETYVENWVHTYIDKTRQPGIYIYISLTVIAIVGIVSVTKML